MKYLLTAVITLLLTTIDAHLLRLVPHHFPGSVPINGAFWTGPNIPGGGMNNMIPRHAMWNSFGPGPQTWGYRNNDIPMIPPVGNGFNMQRNILNNNVVRTNDPWEHYRRFTSGMQSFSSGNQGQINGVSTNVVPANQLSPGFVNNNNNVPWNTFATQSFNPNVVTIPNGVNQGFVSPQLQPNFNTGFANNQFQNQGFPNAIPMQNGAFV